MTVYAVLVHDSDAENPFFAWDTLGKLMMCNPRYISGNVTPSDLGDFCNSRFDEDVVLYDLYTDDPFMVAEYARKCGALTSDVDGGFVIVGHDQIMKEYGYDNAKSRKLAQSVIDAEAREYTSWADGEVYGIVLCDDGDEDDPSDFDIDLGEYPDDSDVVVEAIFGYYGYDNAYQEAKDMIRQHRAYKRKSVADRQENAKENAKANLVMNSKRGSKVGTKHKSCSAKAKKSAKCGKTSGSKKSGFVQKAKGRR